MPLSKLDARLINIDRIVEYGKKDKLQVIDSDTREVLTNVKLWNWKKLNPTEQSAPTFKFTFAQDATTRDLFSTCVVAFNGIIHDVLVRNKPESVSGVLWEFRTRPTNEAVT